MSFATAVHLGRWADPHQSQAHVGHAAFSSRYLPPTCWLQATQSEDMPLATGTDCTPRAVTSNTVSTLLKCRRMHILTCRKSPWRSENTIFTMACPIRDIMGLPQRYGENLFSTRSRIAQQEKGHLHGSDNIPTQNWSDSRTGQKGFSCTTLVTESLTLMAGTSRVPLAFILYRLWTPVVVSSEIPLIPAGRGRGFTLAGVNIAANQHILGASLRGPS